MFARQAQQVSRRAFSSTSRVAGAHFKEGVYENIPFKVHNRKVPFAVLHFGFFGLAAAIPFVAVFVQLKRSGSI